MSCLIFTNILGSEILKKITRYLNTKQGFKQIITVMKNSSILWEDTKNVFIVVFKTFQQKYLIYRFCVRNVIVLFT